MYLDNRYLRVLRERRGFRQIDLAKAASISRAYLSMLESGERRSVSPGVAARLAGALGVAIEELCPVAPRLSPTVNVRRPRQSPGPS
jgi:transcriptional regulator with XRE-family HTH domain